MPNESPRERLLLDAAAATRERGQCYGSPRDHFARTVGAINALFAHKLSEPLTPADWGIFMVLDKCAREQHLPKRDNMTDVAGYAGCVAEIRAETEAFDASWDLGNKANDQSDAAHKEELAAMRTKWMRAEARTVFAPGLRWTTRPNPMREKDSFIHVLGHPFRQENAPMHGFSHQDAADIVAILNDWAEQHKAWDEPIDKEQTA
jgi:hypothetical protein